MEKIFAELEQLGLFKWLDEEHNLSNNRNVTPEYLDNLPITDIHRTVMNACAFRWFRDKYNLLGYIGQATISKGKVFMFCCNEGNDLLFENIDSDFDTYPEAEFACLKKLIEIVKS